MDRSHYTEAFERLETLFMPLRGTAEVDNVTSTPRAKDAFLDTLLDIYDFVLEEQAWARSRRGVPTDYRNLLILTQANYLLARVRNEEPEAFLEAARELLNLLKALGIEERGPTQPDDSRPV